MDKSSVLNIEDVLRTEGRYVGMTQGVSMLPMIKSGKDVVSIIAKNGRLKVFDVALYKRSDGAYILHRVLQVVNGGYIIRGDNCYVDEKVAEESVIGFLECYFKGEKLINLDSDSYKRYVKRRLKTYKLRRFFVLSYRNAKSLLKRMLKGGKHD